MMQDDSGLLVGRELFESSRQLQEFFIPGGPHRGGGLIEGQQGARAGRQVVQRTFQCGVALHAPQPADFVDDITGQDLLQPGKQGLLAVTAKLSHALMRFQERLLDHAGEIELPDQPRIEIEPGLEPEKGPKPLKLTRISE